MTVELFINGWLADRWIVKEEIADIVNYKMIINKLNIIIFENSKGTNWEIPIKDFPQTIHYFDPACLLIHINPVSQNFSPLPLFVDIHKRYMKKVGQHAKNCKIQRFERTRLLQNISQGIANIRSTPIHPFSCWSVFG